MSSSLSMKILVWNDRTGEHIEVGEDPDGLALTEIRFVADDGKPQEPPIVLTDEQLPELIKALQMITEFKSRRDA